MRKRKNHRRPHARLNLSFNVFPLNGTTRVTRVTRGSQRKLEITLLVAFTFCGFASGDRERCVKEESSCDESAEKKEEEDLTNEEEEDHTGRRGIAMKNHATKNGGQ